MEYVGLDVSKDDFYADFGAGRPVRFANDPAGVAGLAARMATAGFAPGGTTVGMEATGVYHLLVARLLAEGGWRTAVINPLQASRFGRLTLRRVKTDRADAAVVRAAAAAGLGSPADGVDAMRLKALVQERASLAGLRARCRQLGHVRDVRTSAAGGAPASPGFGAVEAAIAAQIAEVDARMGAVSPDVQALLRSIPGVGPVCAAALAAKVGDVRRFPDPGRLVAYVGLDCRVHESGTSVRGKGYINKRGDRALRHLLFLAANVSRRYVPELGAYYAKKRGEGKHHFVALCATERKLVHLIWAVWTRGTPYVKKAASVP